MRAVCEGQRRHSAAHLGRGWRRRDARPCGARTQNVRLDGRGAEGWGGERCEDPRGLHARRTRGGAALLLLVLAAEGAKNGERVRVCTAHKPSLVQLYYIS